jgi:phosphoglycolate phosphatase-like HAD superfamily hydrolase
MIKLVVFDFDGVLVDSNEAFAGAYKEATERAGVHQDFTYDDIKSQLGKPYIEVFKGSGGACDEETLERVYSHFVDITSSEDFTSSVKHIKGVKRSLFNLKKSVRLAVGSGNSKRMLNGLLSKLGLTRYFDFVVSGDDVKKGKPSPDMLIKAMKHFRVKPREAVYVGDSRHDIMAAKRAGMRSVAVLTGVLTREEAKRLHPDFIVEDATKVHEVLACLN